MDNLEICFDLETCARTAHSAVMSIGAVPWTRDTEAARPFLDLQEDGFFFETIDLRQCVMDGFEFDQATVDWWSRQNDAAKAAIMCQDPVTLDVAVERFAAWIGRLMAHFSVPKGHVSVWCQGSDFDAAILRHICYKYDIQMPFAYYDVRDCRTYIKEATDIIVRSMGHDALTHEDEKAFMQEIMLRNLPDEELINKQPHSALSDCRFSILRTWSLMCELRHGFSFPENPKEP